MKRGLLGLISGCFMVVLSAACAPASTPTPIVPTEPKPKVQATVGATRIPAPVAVTPTAVARAPQPAKPAESPYYQGRTIEIIVESAAGGGTDTVARITAAVLPRHLPGNPKIIIRNQPGAQGALANNIFYEKAKPDGLTLIQNSSGPIGLQITKPEMAKYDLSKYEYVGNISRLASIIVMRKALLRNLTDPKAQPLVVGTREGSETNQGPLIWGKEFLGWNVRWVSGYGGTSEMELAFFRGELDVLASSNITIIDRANKEGVGQNFTTEGLFSGGKMVRHPNYPDVPTFEELLGDKRPTGIAWQAYRLWGGPKLLDKNLAAPPGTPSNIMNILRSAFASMAKDAQFKDMMARMDTDIFTVGVGDETANIVKDLVNTPQKVLDYTRALQRKVGIIK